MWIKSFQHGIEEKKYVKQYVNHKDNVLCLLGKVTLVLKFVILN